MKTTDMHRIRERLFSLRMRQKEFLRRLVATPMGKKRSLNSGAISMMVSGDRPTRPEDIPYICAALETDIVAEIFPALAPDNIRQIMKEIGVGNG